jgi:hypothetical protein
MARAIRAHIDARAHAPTITRACTRANVDRRLRAHPNPVARQGGGVGEIFGFARFRTASLHDLDRSMREDDSLYATASLRLTPAAVTDEGADAVAGIARVRVWRGGGCAPPSASHDMALADTLTGPSLE